ncbi:MAG: hypothetical protein V5B35_06730 [Candidatus Accumulibacter necessarius]|jgi:hypothetical protein|uniref:hypothetical protein n=1 Tax=Candidatus Accumulibacter necessarius TaxID=2954386 RepID=UPI002FC381FF
MNHPVLLKAEKLIRVGDIVGAEAALVSLVESEGDDALVVALDDFPAKDLLAVLRDFDSSRESVVNLLVSPEKFARAIVLEQRYGDRSHERLHGMINSVVFRAGGDPGEFLEAIGEIEGGSETLADYFCERAEAIEHFFRTATFDFFADADEGTDELSDEERLDLLSDSDANRPFLNHSEVNDHDWMELAWTLRYQHPEIFREVLLILRARARAEEGQAAGVAQPSSAEQRPPAGQEEESAL